MDVAVNGKSDELLIRKVLLQVTYKKTQVAFGTNYELGIIILLWIRYVSVRPPGRERVSITGGVEGILPRRERVML